MSQLPLSVRALRYAATLVFATLLGACGSSSRVEDYVPTRIISFGDELSVIKSGGGKYTVNGFTSGTTTPDCTVNPIWNQALATNFGLAFTQCPGAIVGANGLMAAQQGATVDAIEAQINSVLPAELVPSTLVTIQGGLWDVINAYNGVKAGGDPAAAMTLMGQKGAKLSDLVNRLTNNGAGARVIYSTIPDLGCAPLAFNEGIAQGACSDLRSRSDVLTELTRTFNEAFRSGFARVSGSETRVQYGGGVINDGRYAGLVASDDILRSMSNVNFRTTLYGLKNSDVATRTAACVPTDISACNLTTLVTDADASASTYLWASDRLPGLPWHLQVGNRAISVARNNPF
jgi:hypothetical protein